MPGWRGLDRLRDAKGAIHRAGERHRQQHDRRRVSRHGLQRQRVQRVVHQRVRRRQRRGQRREAGLAGGQLFAVAHELEARVHRVAQHVGDVVQEQRGDMPRAVVRAQCAEGPGQGVGTVLADIGVQRREARPFGQEAAAGDAVHQRRIAPLQEGQRRFDAAQVVVETLLEGVDVRRARRHRQRGDGLAQCEQAFARQQLQHQRQRQVLLHRVHAARAQEAGEVRRGRVRRVQLRHRRDDRQHTRRRTRHAALSMPRAEVSRSRTPPFRRLPGGAARCRSRCGSDPGPPSST